MAVAGQRQYNTNTMNKNVDQRRAKRWQQQAQGQQGNFNPMQRDLGQAPTAQGQGQGQMVGFGDMWMNPFHTSPFHPLSSTITISVHGLAADVTLRELRERFSKYGKTLRVWCVEGSEHGMVTYRHTSEAEAAIRGEFNAQFKGEEIKVAPSMYSAAAPCSVKPGDEKYWRCFMCHNTNRSTSETCNAYKCGYTKEESDKEWLDAEVVDTESASKKRWELAQLIRETQQSDDTPDVLYTGPHCLIIMNLTPAITEQQIRRVFLRYGQINQLRVLMPTESDRTIEAQIVFEDSDALEQAVEFENGKQISPQHRVRAHRCTTPFVIAVVPTHAFGIVGNELHDSLQQIFSEFGVVKGIEVHKDMCTVSVFSLRTVRLAIMHLNKRVICERHVTVHLLNCRETKWPCLNCCNINPPGTQNCMDCNMSQPDFSVVPLPKAWAEATRKRSSDFKVKEVGGKGKGRHHPHAFHNGKHDGAAGKGFNHHDRGLGYKGAGAGVGAIHHQVPEQHAVDEGDPSVLEMLQKAAGAGVARRHRDENHGPSGPSCPSGPGFKGGGNLQRQHRHFQGGYYGGKSGGPCVACGLKSYLLCKCCNSFFCNDKCQNAIIHPKQVLRN